MLRCCSRAVAAAAVTLMASAACAPARDPALGANTPGDSVREVEAVYRSGIAAFNRHALDEFVSGFAEDIIMYTPTGWLIGRTAVHERFAMTFTQFPRVRMVVDSLQVRSVGPATATVAFRWRVYPLGEGPAFHGVGSGVYVRRGSSWVEVLEHETVTETDAALRQRPPQP